MCWFLAQRGSNLRDTLLALEVAAKAGSRGTARPSPSARWCIWPPRARKGSQRFAKELLWIFARYKYRMSQNISGVAYAAAEHSNLPTPGTLRELGAWGMNDQRGRAGSAELCQRHGTAYPGARPVSSVFPLCPLWVRCVLSCTCGLCRNPSTVHSAHSETRCGSWVAVRASGERHRATWQAYRQREIPGRDRDVRIDWPCS